MPPPKPRCYELLVKKASDKLNITCIPARLSIITKPLNRAGRRVTTAASAIAAAR